MPLTGSPNGPFFENSRIGPEAFTDGLSNTTAVTETIRSTATSTYANDPLESFRHRQQQHDRPPAQLRRGLRGALLKPTEDDDAVPGNSRSPLALRSSWAYPVQPSSAAQR